MLINLLILLAGLAMLLIGADRFIEGSVGLARRLHIPELVIGLTIISMGTSMPELVVNVVSSIKGTDGVSYGNVLGSNLFNLLFILGASAIIRPLPIAASTLKIEAPLSAAITLLTLFFSMSFLGAANLFSRGEAMLFILIFVGFLWYNQKLSMVQSDEAEHHHKHSWQLNTIFALSGLALLIGGGKLAVDKAVLLAHDYFGVSDKLIGLTVLAAGTSLPEMITSLVAVYKKRYGVAVGNVIGSNIFNLLLILGVSGLIRPLRFDPTLIPDFAVLTAGTLIFCFLGYTKRTLARWEGALLVLMYIGYSVFLFWRG